MRQDPILERLSQGERCVIFHIGTTKTATTYIQSLAKKNAPLLSTAGVLYPTSHPEIAFGHHSIPIEIGAGLYDGPSLTHYRGLGGTEKHILLSSESISEIPLGQIARLRTLYPDRPAYAVVYFREPLGFLSSWLQEGIKHGWTGAFDPEYRAKVHRFVDDPFSDHSFNYPALARRVVEVFGPERTLFVAYDNLRASGEDFFTHFLGKVIGLPPLEVDMSDPYRNESMGLDRQEILRLFNSLIERRGGQRGTWLFRYLRKHHNRLVRAVPEFVKIANYAVAEKVGSREGGLGLLEKRLAEFSDLFLNAAGDGWIFDQEYERELTSVDLIGFWTSLDPLTRRIVDAFVEDALARRQEFVDVNESRVQVLVMP